MVWCNMGVPLDNVKSTKPFFFLSFPCVPSGVDKAQYEAVPGRVSFPPLMLSGRWLHAGSLERPVSDAR